MIFLNFFLSCCVLWPQFYPLNSRFLQSISQSCLNLVHISRIIRELCRWPWPACGSWVEPDALEPVHNIVSTTNKHQNIVSTTNLFLHKSQQHQPTSETSQEHWGWLGTTNYHMIVSNINPLHPLLWKNCAVQRLTLPLFNDQIGKVVIDRLPYSNKDKLA